MVKYKKQPKLTQIGSLLNKLWYIHNLQYNAENKNECGKFFCTNMNGSPRYTMRHKKQRQFLFYVTICVKEKKKRTYALKTFLKESSNN